jgi:hypothetical protein
MGCEVFSEALRAELAGQPRIHICDVYPSFIDTPGISHSANYVGRVLTAPPPVYDARRVARTIVDLAKRPRASTTVGEAATVIRFLHFLAPQLTANLAAFLMQAYFRRARECRPRTEIFSRRLQGRWHRWRVAREAAFTCGRNNGGDRVCRMRSGSADERPPTARPPSIIVLGFFATIPAGRVRMSLAAIKVRQRGILPVQVDSGHQEPGRSARGPWL